MALPVIIAAAGAKALIATGINLLAGKIVDEIGGIFAEGFGTASLTVLFGNDWRDSIAPDNQYCWDWPFPGRWWSTNEAIPAAQIATGQRAVGDKKAYLSPYIAVLPEIPSIPVAAGWRAWQQAHPSSRQATLRSSFKGPFVVVWREGTDPQGNWRGPQHALVAGVVDYTGQFKPTTLGKAVSIGAGHPYGGAVPGQPLRPELTDAMTAWRNALEGRSTEIPPEILRLFFGSAPPDDSEYFGAITPQRKSKIVPIIVGGVIIALWLM